MEESQQASMMQRLKRFYHECVRVLTVTKKPDSTEFKTIVKVSGLGIALIGVIGFIITLVKQLTIG